MPGALPHSSFSGPQGENVTGPAEAGRDGSGIGQGVARQRAVVRGYARGDGGVGRVDADRVCRGAGVLVQGDHLREVELDGALGQDGRADEA